MIFFNKFWKIGNFFSIFLIILSIYFISTRPLNLGIDFTGGILMEISQSGDKPMFTNNNIANISDNLIKESIKSLIQRNGENGLIIKLQLLNGETQSIIEKTKSIIDAELNEVEYTKTDFMGAQISDEFFKKSCMALILSLIGIMIYLFFRFDLRFAIGGIIGLIHDVMITSGFIALLNIEINMITITAILTIIGYSINDSVIIYDRIREIFKLKNHNSIIENINLALNNTLKRTLFTSLTTLFSALALIIFGGATLHPFSYVVFFGILIGTYSSIIISSQLVNILTIKTDHLAIKT